MTFNVYTQGGGGGGGSYTGGNGITVTDGTITNTGTLIQPAGAYPQGIAWVAGSGTGTANGAGVGIYSGAPGPDGVSSGAVNMQSYGVTGSGTKHSGGVEMEAGRITLTDTLSSGYGGAAVGIGGYVSNGAASANPGQFAASGAVILNGQTATGGYGYIYGGSATGSPTNIGGNTGLLSGDGDQRGGNVILHTGAGAINGVVLISTIGTVDPAVLGAVWQKSVATVGYVLMRSQG